MGWFFDFQREEMGDYYPPKIKIMKKKKEPKKVNVIEDYTERTRKLAVQSEIYPLITNKTFIGLCGPNVIEYLEKIGYKRFKRITLYEIDKAVFRKIVRALVGKFEYRHVEVVNDSINNHLGRTKAFYDLDYCKSFEDIREFMPKIAKIEEFSITVSLRPYAFPTGAFRSYVGHSAFRHWTYRDGNPMITTLVSKKNFN